MLVSQRSMQQWSHHSLRPFLLQPIGDLLLFLLLLPLSELDRALMDNNGQGTDNQPAQ
jgi:hypothetical protein